MRDRAYLRAQEQRKKQRVKDYDNAQEWFRVDIGIEHRPTPKSIGLIATTPRPFSDKDYWTNRKLERQQAKQDINEQMKDAGWA